MTVSNIVLLKYIYFLQCMVLLPEYTSCRLKWYTGQKTFSLSDNLFLFTWRLLYGWFFALFHKQQVLCVHVCGFFECIETHIIFKYLPLCRFIHCITYVLYMHIVSACWLQTTKKSVLTSTITIHKSTFLTHGHLITIILWFILTIANGIS